MAALLNRTGAVALSTTRDGPRRRGARRRFMELGVCISPFREIVTFGAVHSTAVFYTAQ